MGDERGQHLKGRNIVKDMRSMLRTVQPTLKWRVVTSANPARNHGQVGPPLAERFITGRRVGQRQWRAWVSLPDGKVRLLARWAAMLPPTSSTGRPPAPAGPQTPYGSVDGHRPQSGRWARRGKRSAQPDQDGKGGERSTKRADLSAGPSEVRRALGQCACAGPSLR